MRALRCLCVLAISMAACSSEPADGGVAANDSAGVDEGVADTSATEDALLADSGAAADTTPADATSDADPYGAYPAGPYGTKVGETLAPLDWIGYVNGTADAVSTTKPYAPTSLDALRRSGKGYGIVHLSEFG